MHKFFVEREKITGHTAIISGDDVKHIYKVLRLKTGHEIKINNCCGQEFLGIINSIGKDEVKVELKQELQVDNESPVDVYLFQGFPKSSKMDLIVQKATELGVKKVFPVFTERTVVKNKQGEIRKLGRWNKIAMEACKQCKRTVIPKVEHPLDFKDALDILKSMDLAVVPYENRKKYGIKALLEKTDRTKIKKIGILIGPEGGFSENEIADLKDIEAGIITLGPRILRTETAGFVCTSLLMYELGDLGGL